MRQARSLTARRLDTRDRLGAAKEFWRRRKAARGRRCDGAVDDRGDSLLSSGATVDVRAAIAPPLICSESPPGSSLGWLISRTGLAWKRRPALGRQSSAPIKAPRQTPSCARGNFGNLNCGLVTTTCLGYARRFRCPTRRCRRRRPPARGRRSTKPRRAATVVLLSSITAGLRS